MLLELWESGNRSCDFQGRFLPVFFTAFGPTIHSLFLFHSFLFTYRIPAHLDAMRVVHQPVENAIGQCGISDLFVPASHWQLRSQNHRSRLVAILGDLPEVSSQRPSNSGRCCFLQVVMDRCAPQESKSIRNCDVTTSGQDPAQHGFLRSTRI